MNLMARNKRDERMRSEARAEVLAACIKHFETEAEGCADYANEETGEARAAWNRDEERYQSCADDLRKLQPAAKDLEALLRDEREKGRQEERKEVLYDVLAFNCGLGCTPQEGYRDLAEALRDTKHLVVEKARAIRVRG